MVCKHRLLCSYYHLFLNYLSFFLILVFAQVSSSSIWSFLEYSCLIRLRFIGLYSIFTARSYCFYHFYRTFQGDEHRKPGGKLFQRFGVANSTVAQTLQIYCQRCTRNRRCRTKRSTSRSERFYAQSEGAFGQQETSRSNHTAASKISTRTGACR